MTKTKSTPGIEVANSDEFKRLIAGLADDIVDAHIHWKIYVDLSDALSRAPLVVAQSRTFWNLTLRSHAETAIACLCRAFDQEVSALHLKNWLATIRAHLHLFSEEHFHARLSGNTFVDSLAADPRVPDEEQLSADIALCSRADQLVKKLVVHRNNSVAHRSATLTASGSSVSPSLVLTNDEFEELLERARTILNRYSQLFAAEVHSVQIIGHNDYDFVVKSVASQVERSREEFDQPLSSSGFA